MSSIENDEHRRDAILRRLTDAGRNMSDAAVLYHSRAAELFGLGVTDWKALGIIQNSEPLTHRDLVQQIRLKPASVTNILDRLERQDWIVRAKAEHDARQISISVNQQKLTTFRERVFQSLLRRLAKIYEAYSDDELVLIARALEDIAQAQRDSADEL